ncbi:sigma 54-interacting transcriptional regulator [Clostridium sp.]|uniref:sigma-54 interaction domain-containing protein n=1 Tax=Clostridium sp. TaxID=1506 RepID=UPI002FCC5FE3
MYSFQDIIGNSTEIESVKYIGKRACNSDSPILIYGETGTGKELIVQAIHSGSKRKNKNFIPQNCAAIPENLLESIFFGVSKGSFTGAEAKAGLFELADGGTLYLDELNSMPVNFQGKLLRVLQDGEVRRIGDSASKRVDVRVVASLNEKPEELMALGKLRKDLFYRLSVVRINLPELNDRKGDIPSLVNYFINKFNKKFGVNIEDISEEALNYLIVRDYEGNIRELEHIIESGFNVRNQGILTFEDLNLKREKREFKVLSLKDKLEYQEQKYIKEALVIAKYNVSKAAKLLDIPRQTLQYKIKKYAIE